MKNNLLFKLLLFNLSLFPLYFIFIFQYVDFEFYEKEFSLYTFYELFKTFVCINKIIIFLVLLIFIGYLGFYVFNKNNRYNREDAKIFYDIETKDFDHLTFLSTYIIPLITFNLINTRSFIVVCLLLIMIGIIYIKSNLYYLNPTLLLFGYKIYKAKENGRNLVLITKNVILDAQVESKYIDLGNNIYFLKD